MIHIVPTQVGIDEVGRGAWAGPMVAAAVLFPIKPRVPRTIPIRDSKLLTSIARKRAYDFITQRAIYTVVDVGPDIIDAHGVHEAHKVLIRKCVDSFLYKYNEISSNFSDRPHRIDELTFYIDGRKITDLRVNHIYQPHGDYSYKIISCASIIAKVQRDQYMKEISKVYQEYGFDEHVGYGTTKHQKAIETYGPTPIHRMSYRPLLNRKSYPQDSEK